MSEIARLREGLRQLVARPIETPAVPKALTQEIARLKRQLGEGGSEAPSRDRMREAVSSFWQKGRFSTLGEARLVCFGSIERFTPQRPALIEDASAFPRLLDQVDGYSREARAFRRCYRGLINCYFAYDPCDEKTPKAGALNWERLREYLEARYDAVRVKGFEPEWVIALEKHRNLLTEDPVRRYAAAALRGNSEEFSGACRAIEISEMSWLVRRLVLAQVEFATEQPDERFKSYVTPLCHTLNQHPNVIDEGVAGLVNRYAEAMVREEHGTLRDSALALWGNPLLRLNRAKWGRVTDGARRMVANWLKLDLIQQFFDILTEDRATDNRRVEFWKRYHDQMESMYFALGSTARWSGSADIRNLRKKMGDLELRLVRGGRAANNAFIMLLDRYVVVEFGVSGNACFIFDRAQLPFALQGEVAGDSSGLKHQGHTHRLLHVDTSWGRWEREFERVLGGLGIRAESDPDQRRRRTRSSGSGRSNERSSGLAFSGDNLRELAHQHGLEIRDLTWKGGRLWVVGAQAADTAGKQLSRWNFRWAEHRGAWYREGWD